MTKSLGEMIAHVGSVFQAGFCVISPNETPARGRCETARIAACSAGRSAQKTSWNDAGSMMNSASGADPGFVGYCVGRSAGRTLLSVA